MSSKKEIIEQVNGYFSSNDVEGFLALCTEDISWTMVGTPAVKGKQAIREFMKNGDGGTAPDLTVEKVFADEHTGAGTGTMKMTNAAGQTVESAFCDVYDFEGDKIKSMISYIIDFKNS